MSRCRQRSALAGRVRVRSGLTASARLFARGAIPPTWDRANTSAGDRQIGHDAGSRISATAPRFAWT